MNNVIEIANKLMTRMKLLKKFEVEIQLPENFIFAPNGKIPYDLKISDGVAIGEVYAESYQEAESQLIKYFEDNQK